MATTYGATDAGFRRKTTAEIIADIEADQLASIYEDLDVSDESVVGQMNGIFAVQLGAAWEQLETLYNAGDADAAEGRLLDNLCKLLGVYRLGATYGTVTLACGLTAGTTLVAGTHFASVTGQPDIRWTPSADYTASVSGIQNVVFVAEAAGEVVAIAGSITTIATPIPGWTSVGQALDADPGESGESSAALRARRKRELAKLGSATLIAIRSGVSAAFAAVGQQVDQIAVYENDGETTDVDGRPPHTVEVIVFDGSPPLAGNDAIIAQAIVDSGLSGEKTFGTTTANALVLSGTQTVTKAINFTRVTPVTIAVQVNLTKGPNYPGDAALAAYLAKTWNAYHQPGDDVWWTYLVSEVFSLGGVSRVDDIKVNLVSQQNVPINIREIARFNAAAVLIIST